MDRRLRVDPHAAASRAVEQTLAALDAVVENMLAGAEAVLLAEIAARLGDVDPAIALEAVDHVLASERQATLSHRERLEKELERAFGHQDPPQRERAVLDG
jgi:hypothetical protein